MHRLMLISQGCCVVLCSIALTICLPLCLAAVDDVGGIAGPALGTDWTIWTTLRDHKNLAYYYK